MEKGRRTVDKEVGTDVVVSVNRGHVVLAHVCCGSDWRSGARTK